MRQLEISNLRCEEGGQAWGVPLEAKVVASRGESREGLVGAWWGPGTVGSAEQHS